MYLDYADDQARKRRAMTMADWVTKLDAFLEFHERTVLGHAGRVSHELALEHAVEELERYQARQRTLDAAETRSDFDRFVARVKELEERGENEDGSHG